MMLLGETEKRITSALPTIPSDDPIPEWWAIWGFNANNLLGFPPYPLLSLT